MNKQINNFIADLKVERQYALNTIIAYKRDLDKLLYFSDKYNINTWALTKAQIILFIKHLKFNNASGRTIRRALSTIRKFLSYLVKQEVIKNNYALDLPIPKITKNLPKTLDYNNIEKMLIAKSNNWTELRDIAIIETLYSAGLRLGELVGLNFTDIDMDKGFVQVIGKGAKMRHTPIGKLAQRAINNYLQKININKSEALFINSKQTRINARTVQNMIKKRALDAGIKINVHPHMLRHAAASHFLQSSHDLLAVQDFLGHKSIKSTQVYTHLDFLALSQVYDKCHPRAKK